MAFDAKPHARSGRRAHRKANSLSGWENHRIPRIKTRRINPGNGVDRRAKMWRDPSDERGLSLLSADAGARHDLKARDGIVGQGPPRDPRALRLNPNRLAIDAERRISAGHPHLLA